MKALFSIIVFVLMLLFCNTTKAQENSLVLSYDNGGNMTQRKVQVMFGARFAAPDIQQKDSLPPMKIYPNPTNDYVNIEGKLPENVRKAELLISTTDGRILKTDVYTGEAKQISVYNLAKGMYLLEFIYSKKQRDTYKIIVN
ncbi:MAG: T9SS type A sorting domain-containing protein [Bacteroidetes bacterium]|nr:T9SS type A sorting domain-containing protein [Bacteroidota bacterium]